MISYISTKGRSNFKICADSLTSSVIDLLKYLPTNLFWKVFKEAMYQDKLPKSCGELKSIEYWPKWNADETSNQNFIEPDVFIRFESFDLLIEAKRFDAGGQYDNQLSKEIKAYNNEYSEDNKKLFFIKLGGLNNYDDELNKEATICKTDWFKILNGVVNLKDELENCQYLNTDHLIRLLDDSIESFSIHHYYHLQWLNDLTKIKINKTEITF